MPTSDDLLLDARDIRHAYRDGRFETPVLHGVDLSLRRGEFCMIMGPSGCGKTTLLNILGLMMSPTAGRLRIDGIDAHALDDAGRTALRRDKLGFVFQRFNLLPVLSAEQNVIMALKLRSEPVNGQPLSVLDRVGLAAKRRNKPAALSVGEQQRVAIARALVCKPVLLLADEPTGNLDSQSAAAVMDLLRELNRADGLTILMITHNEHLAGQADRVLHMQDGRFVEVPGPIPSPSGRGPG